MSNKTFPMVSSFFWPQKMYMMDEKRKKGFGFTISFFNFTAHYCSIHIHLLSKSRWQLVHYSVEKDEVFYVHRQHPLVCPSSSRRQSIVIIGLVAIFRFICSQTPLEIMITRKKNVCTFVGCRYIKQTHAHVLKKSFTVLEFQSLRIKDWVSIVRV